jgi:hypothetical protein
MWAGMQCVTSVVMRGSTPALVGFASQEVTVKDCGVTVAMLPGQELGA